MKKRGYIDTHFIFYKGKENKLLNLYSNQITVKQTNNNKNVCVLIWPRAIEPDKVKAFYPFYGGVPSVHGEILSLIQQILSTRYGARF